MLTKNFKYFFSLHVTFIKAISFRYHWISHALSAYFRATHWERRQERRRKLPTDFFRFKWFCWKVVFVGTPHYNEKFGNTKPLEMVYYLVRKVINTTHHKLMLLYWLRCRHSFATQESQRENSEHNRRNAKGNNFLKNCRLIYMAQVVSMFSIRQPESMTRKTYASHAYSDSKR